MLHLQLFGWWFLANYLLWVLYTSCFVLQTFGVNVHITLKTLVVLCTGMAVTGTFVIWPDAPCVS